MLSRIISLFVLGFFLVGCSAKIATVEENAQKINNLTTMLSTLKGIDKYEAHNLAKHSVNYSQNLIKEYKLVSPPLWQNSLVNMGFKKRGLCYEWAEDLLLHLSKYAYKTLEIHQVGADIGSYFEHNALSVSRKGDGIYGSILLDAWRHSGDLFFIKIEEDKKYQWKERFDLK